MNFLWISTLAIFGLFLGSFIASSTIPTVSKEKLVKIRELLIDNLLNFFNTQPSLKPPFANEDYVSYDDAKYSDAMIKISEFLDSDSLLNFYSDPMIKISEFLDSDSLRNFSSTTKSSALAVDRMMSTRLLKFSPYFYFSDRLMNKIVYAVLNQSFPQKMNINDPDALNCVIDLISKFYNYRAFRHMPRDVYLSIVLFISPSVVTTQYRNGLHHCLLVSYISSVFQAIAPREEKHLAHLLYLSIDKFDLVMNYIFNAEFLLNSIESFLCSIYEKPFEICAAYTIENFEPSLRNVNNFINSVPDADSVLSSFFNVLIDPGNSIPRLTLVWMAFAKYYSNGIEPSSIYFVKSFLFNLFEDFKLIHPKYFEEIIIGLPSYELLEKSIISQIENFSTTLHLCFAGRHQNTVLFVIQKSVFPQEALNTFFSRAVSYNLSKVIEFILKIKEFQDVILLKALQFENICIDSFKILYAELKNKFPHSITQNLMDELLSNSFEYNNVFKCKFLLNDTEFKFSDKCFENALRYCKSNTEKPIFKFLMNQSYYFFSQDAIDDILIPAASHSYMCEMNLFSDYLPRFSRKAIDSAIQVAIVNENVNFIRLVIESGYGYILQSDSLLHLAATSKCNQSVFQFIIENIGNVSLVGLKMAIEVVRNSKEQEGITGYLFKSDDWDSWTQFNETYLDFSVRRNFFTKTEKSNILRYLERIESSMS